MGDCWICDNDPGGGDIYGGNEKHPGCLAEMKRRDTNKLCIKCGDKLTSGTGRYHNSCMHAGFTGYPGR